MPSGIIVANWESSVWHWRDVGSPLGWASLAFNPVITCCWGIFLSLPGKWIAPTFLGWNWKKDYRRTLTDRVLVSLFRLHRGPPTKRYRRGNNNSAGCVFHHCGRAFLIPPRRRPPPSGGPALWQQWKIDSSLCPRWTCRSGEMLADREMTTFKLGLGHKTDYPDFGMLCQPAGQGADPCVTRTSPTVHIPVKNT